MQELTLFGGLARMQIPQEIEIGVSQNLGLFLYSIMRDCLPKIEKNKTVDIVSYEFYPEEWHDNQVISQNLCWPSYSIMSRCLPYSIMSNCLPKIEGAKSVKILSYEFNPEEWYDNRIKGKMFSDIQNEENLHKYKQNAKKSESYLKLIYLEKNVLWQELWDKIIEINDLNNLTIVIEKCIENLSSNEGRFKLEIRYQDRGYYYDSSLGDPAWLKYTMRLMTRRCLQIWQKLNNAQIKRGLALQQRGLYSMNGSIESLNSANAIQKQGKGDNAPWVVMDINSLKPYRSKLLPDRGVEAAKRRAREWKKQGLFPSDKS